jgi:hypothetical protein
MRQFPRAIHAWAQSDRYALALNFEKNNFDFFKPETYCLNPQFPAEQTPVPEKGITRVDFPVHEYLIAIIMNVTGSHSPYIFRLYILLWGLLGLCFLFQITRQFTSSMLTGCFVVVFAFTAPVFTYYLNGFLPSIPALSAMLGGYFFYMKYRHKRKYLYWICSMAFFTLSALTRTPFVIFLIAITGQTILYFILDKKWSWKLILAPIVGFLIIGGYFLYNLSLGIKYGSVFLSNVMPPSSFQEAKEIMSAIRENWLYQYLTGWHYIFLGAIAVAALVTTIARKKVSGVVRGGWIHFGIVFAGVLFYFIFMMRQFIAHDYYFLDTFFPLILLGLVLLSAAIPVNHKNYRNVTLVFFLAFACVFVLRSQKVQAFRYTTGVQNPVDESIRDFTGADAFLDQSGVPDNARMLVLNSYTPNIPMILMDRKGYAVFGAEKGEALPFINKEWDYAVIQENMPVLDLLAKDSALYLRLQRYASNGSIGLYKKCDPKNTVDMAEFLNLNEKTITFTDSLVFDIDTSIKDIPYKNAVHKETDGKMVLEITEAAEFVEMLNAASTELKSGNAKRLFVSGNIRGDSTTVSQWPELILAINDAQETYLYYSFKIGPYLKQGKDGWSKFAFQYGIPLQKNPNDTIKLYWWNPEKGHYKVENVCITLAH